MENAAERHLQDDHGRQYDLTAPRWRGEAGGPLILSDLPGIGPEDIDRSEHGLWRYRRAFALDYQASVSLGEGGTPLLKRRFRGRDLLFKLDWLNPSGSFKDRGAALVASTLVTQGIDEAMTDSSGNGGSSFAAFCAASGIRLKIVVPEATSASKVLQARAYGAEIELVPGGRSQAQQAAHQQSDRLFYIGHNWNPFFLEGVKTIGYELWEDLGFKVPDNIVIVSGAGSIALGCDTAFRELMRAGQIDRLPRLLLAQPRVCCPIFNAFHDLSERGDPGAAVHGLAEGAAIPAPVRLDRVVEAVRRSRGTVVAVDEADIAQATRDLASIGFYCEPTSAVGAAAVDELSKTGWIEDGSETVVILTGSGLKTGAAIEKIMSAV